MKKFILLILSFAFAVSAPVYAFDIDMALNDTAAYVYAHTPSPAVGSVGGEWAVTGLARSGYAVPDDYYENYYSAVCSLVAENNGVLSANKYTEYSRVIIALTAIGKSPADAAGFDLTAPLGDLNSTSKQGLNGAIWALIALDCGGYCMPECVTQSTQATRELYIKAILDRQLPDGGWALTKAAEAADTDITAMALQALAKYRGRTDVNEAVEKALVYISGALLPDGGFDNSEACSQTLTALSALGIEYDDARFVKSGISVLDKLMSYSLPDGSFSHNNTGTDMMATEQALCALAALNRAENGERSLYSISGRSRAGIHSDYLRLLGMPLSHE